MVQEPLRALGLTLLHQHQHPQPYTSTPNSAPDTELPSDRT